MVFERLKLSIGCLQVLVSSCYNQTNHLCCICLPFMKGQKNTLTATFSMWCSCFFSVSVRLVSSSYGSLDCLCNLYTVLYVRLGCFTV